MKSLSKLAGILYFLALAGTSGRSSSNGVLSAKFTFHRHKEHLASAQQDYVACMGPKHGAPRQCLARFTALLPHPV